MKKRKNKKSVEKNVLLFFKLLKIMRIILLGSNFLKYN